MDRKYKDCIITYVLMGICIIVYLYTTLRYGVEMSAMEGIEVGGFNPLYIYYDHEYFRFITANFIHFGLMHIFCNIYSLYNLGILMEKILKKKKYAIVIIVSMLSTTCFRIFYFYCLIVEQTVSWEEYLVLFLDLLVQLLAVSDSL